MQDIDYDKTENFLENNDFYVNELYKNWGISFLKWMAFEFIWFEFLFL